MAVIATFLVDDMRKMSAPAKIAGQVLAGSLLASQGVQMLYFRVPLWDVLVLDQLLLNAARFSVGRGACGTPPRTPEELAGSRVRGRTAGRSVHMKREKRTTKKGSEKEEGRERECVLARERSRGEKERFGV